MTTYVRLGDVTTKIGSGATPRGGQAVYRQQGTAFIRSQNVLDNRMKLDDIARISDEAADQLSGVEVREGDVLLNITGDSIARVCLVDTDVLPARVSQHVAIIRTTPEMDAGFLQRWLVYEPTKAALLAMSDGGTRKALTKAHIQGLDVPCPPIDVQRGIAEVLGALDDKIAANTQSVNLALELADAEYSQRVRGATPGQTFGEVATVCGGGTPRTSNEDYWNGDVSWATPTDVTALSAPYLTTTARTVSEAGLANCSSALYPAGSILMTSRATIGAFALAQGPTAVNQGFIVVNAHDAALQMWLFHEMRARISEFISHANGATFLELSRGKFKAFTVRVAESQVMADFGVFAEALHEQAAALTAESDRLAATRDALLPLLMSGKVKVKDAESVVGEVL